MSTETMPLHLHALQVSNFMRVGALTIDAKGKNVIISGANNAGKTTSVNAIFVALAGHSSKDIPDPVKHGADKAMIELDLGEYRITRTFTAGGSTSLTVKAKDGSKINRPQDLLNSFLSEYSLDPGAFLVKRECDQIDDILAVCGVKCPVDEVEKITGERFEPKAGESADQYLMRLSADETGVFYDRRRQQGRVVELKKKAQDEAVVALNTIGGRPTADETAKSTEGLAEQLQTQQQLLTSYREMIEARDAKAREAKAAEESTARYRASVEQGKAQAENIKAQIARLNEQLNGLTLKISDDTDKALNSYSKAIKLQSEADTMTAELDQETDPSIRIRELNGMIAEAGAQTRRLGERNQAANFLDQMVDDHKKAVTDHEELDAKLVKLRELRRNILNGVDLGIDGLSIENGKILLDGVTLKQCGNAWRMKLACAVATKQNPRLKLLRIDDGERFDDESIAMLGKMAHEKGWQIIMTRVARKGDLTVEIVDAENMGE